MKMTKELVIHVICLIVPMTVIARLPDLRCEIHIHLLIEQYSHGGVVMDKKTSLYICQYECVHRTPCVAFDYSRQTGRCVMHNNITDIQQTEHKADTNQYRISRCYSFIDNKEKTIKKETVELNLLKDCNISWLAYPNVRSTEGKLIREHVTRIECISICIELPDCQAADYEESDMKCYIHNHVNFHQFVLWNSPGTWQFRMIRCPVKECKVNYDYYKNFQSVGGTYIAGLRTELQCREGCIKASYCLAVDFNVKNNTCFFHVDQETLDYEVFPAPDVVQYRIHGCRECTTRILLLDYEPTGVKVFNKCSRSYEMCLLDCAMSKRYCYAADFKIIHNCCLLHYVPQVYETNNPVNSDLTLIVLQRCPGTALPFSFRQCHYQWRISYNFRHPKELATFTVRGMHVVDKCLSFCEERKECLALDYDSTSSTCYIYLHPTRLTYKSDKSVANYRLIDRCYTPSRELYPYVAKEYVVQWSYLDNNVTKRRLIPHGKSELHHE